MSREAHAPFCEGLGVRFPRPTRLQFNDDQTRVRRGYAANNLVVLRHIVLNLLRHNSSRKVSIKSKRLLACSEDEFREQLLGFAL